MNSFTIKNKRINTKFNYRKMNYKVCSKRGINDIFDNIYL